MLRRADHVVVELDEVRGGRQREGTRIGVLPDVLLVVHDGDARVVDCVEIRRVPSVEPLFQITISRVVGETLREHVLYALLEQVDAVVRQDDDGDAGVGGGHGRRLLRRGRRTS